MGARDVVSGSARSRERVVIAVIAEAGSSERRGLLLKQPYVKDPSQTIEERIKAAVANLRENVVIRRFVRFEIGG